MDGYRIKRDTIKLENGSWWGWCEIRCAWVFRSEPFHESEIVD